MKIKPRYPKKILQEPYINGLWNGIMLGIGIIFSISGIYFVSGLLLLSLGLVYYMLWDR